MKRALRILAALAVVIVLILVGVHVFLMTGLTGFVRTHALPQLRDALGVDVKLDRVSLDAPAGELDLSGFSLGNPDGFTEPQSFSLDKAQVNLGVLSLIGGVTRISDCNIDGIKFVVVRNKDGAINWSQIKEGVEARRPEETGKPKEEETAETPPTEEPVPEKPEGEEKPEDREEPDQVPVVEMPAMKLDNAVITTLVELVDHAEDSKFERVAVKVTIEARNVRTVASGPEEWGTLTVKSHLDSDPNTLITDLKGRVAPILNPYTASFDLEGKLASLETASMADLTRRLDIQGDRVSADVKLTCRDGDFDPKTSVVNLHFTNPRLSGKLAKKAGDIKLPPEMDIPVRIRGSLFRPGIDEAALTVTVLELAARGYVEGKLQKDFDKAVGTFFNKLEKLSGDSTPRNDK